MLLDVLTQHTQRCIANKSLLKLGLRNRRRIDGMIPVKREADHGLYQSRTVQKSLRRGWKANAGFLWRQTWRWELSVTFCYQDFKLLRSD